MDELLQQPEFEKRALLFLNEVEDYASQKNILDTGSIEDDWEEDEEGDDYEAPKTLVTVNNLTTQWISFRSMFEQLAQDSDPDLAEEGKEYLQSRIKKIKHQLKDIQ